MKSETTIVQDVEAMFSCKYSGVVGWQHPHKPASPSSFPSRVRYAAWAIVNDDHERMTDNCFEMYDGDAVAVAIYRAAFGGACGLLEVSLKTWLGSYLPEWEATAAKYAYIADENLGKLAQMVRGEAKRKFEAQQRAWAQKATYTAEPTPAGMQLVIPGCEMNASPKAAQLALQF
jgi:hypothetical protein